MGKLSLIFLIFVAAVEASTVTFVRHGQTDWNVEDRIQGHSDIPLNECGRSQAKELAEELKDCHFDLVYSSDLSRAHETARIIVEGRGLSVQTDQRLRERDCGVWEGRFSKEYFEASFEEQQKTEQNPSLLARMYEFLGELPEDKQILIAAHGGIIRCLLINIKGYNVLDHEIGIKNCATLQIEKRGEEWVIVGMEGFYPRKPHVKLD